MRSDVSPHGQQRHFSAPIKDNPPDQELRIPLDLCVRSTGKTTSISWPTNSTSPNELLYRACNPSARDLVARRNLQSVPLAFADSMLDCLGGQYCRPLIHVHAVRPSQLALCKLQVQPILQIAKPA